MRKILSVLLFPVLLAACTTENRVGDTENTISLEEAAEGLHGLWIADNFLNKIEQNRSIYAARKYNTHILGFYLDRESLLSGHPYLEGFTEHEGGFNTPIKFDESVGGFINDMDNLPEYSSFPNPFRLSFEEDQKLTMYFTKSKKKDLYRKINEELDVYLRKMLFEGDYRYENSAIRFEGNGKVINFKDYQYYEVVYDFGEGINYDVVLFFSSPDGGNWDDATVYQYEFVEDRLKLRQVTPHWESMEYEIANEVVELIKE